MDDLILVLFLVVLMGITGFGFGSQMARDELRTDAVKHGAAHWVIQPNGTTQFIWNTPLTNN